MSSKLRAPYEGDQPYLYISYCPEDMDIVLPILCLLQDEGYRIGYDDGKIPGSGQSDAAARRLDQSAGFLALISGNWLASDRCFEEFTFAQMKRLPSLAVILTPVQLAPTMNLQLASVPAVERSQCTSKEFRTELRGKLDPALRKEPAPPVPRTRIIGIAAALIFLAGIVFAVLTHSGTDSPPAVPSESGTAPSESSAALPPSPEPELDHAAAYHIFLTAAGDMPPEEFPEALATLRGRLDIFTGGEPYEINVEDNSIELYLPKSAFAGVDVEKALKCYISRATELYIFDRASPRSAREWRSIRRDDLAGVTLSQGAIPGVDAAQYGIYSPAYDYLTVQLTDQCAEWFREEIAAWGDGLAFGQDMESAPDYAYCYTFPAGDGKTFYILNNDLGGRFLETQAYNLTHRPLPGSFRITVDLNSMADWQTAESSRMGENQYAPGALTGETVTFTLECYYLRTEEDRLNAEKELKARLDLLGQPYALGLIENEAEDAAVVAVRTGVEHMGLPVIQLICGRGLQLQANYWNIDLWNSHFVWETDHNGASTLALETGPEITDRLTELTGKTGGGTLYLTVGGWPLLGEGGLPVLCASIGQPAPEGRIPFDHLYFDRETGITEEYQWLAALMEQTMSGSSSALHFNLMEIQMDLRDGVIGYDSSRFGISYAGEVRAFADAVGAAAPDAAMEYKRDLSCVYVSLNLSEDLPERGAALAREIYEASGFEGSVFQSLTIYLIAEDDSADERAQIVFQKSYAYASRLDNSLPDSGCVYVSGIFRGEGLDQYQTAFRHIMETDPFYLRLTVEGKTKWSW